MDPLNPLMPQAPSQQPQPQNIPPTPPTIPPRPASNMVPPPPAAADVRVRTMESDAASMKSSGGAEPEPQFVTFPSPTGTNPAPEALEIAAPQGSGTGKAVIWLVVLIIIIAAAWGAYAYVWPMLNITNNAPATVAPIGQPAAPTTTQPAPAPAAAAPAPIPAISLGLTGTPATVTIDTTPTGIIAAIAKEAATKPAEGDVKELALSDANGPVSFSAFIGTLLPEAQKAGLVDLFAGGFSPRFASYVFYDDKGMWPGYVIQMDPAHVPDVATLAAVLQKLETSSYANFFLSAPGTPDVFRAGQVKTKYVNRFVPLSEPGASFNYGIFGNYVIMNTSYGGLLKALELLKL